jgi:hypothetical protein
MDQSAKNLERLLHDKDFATLGHSVIAAEPNVFKIIAAENRELHHSNFLAFLFRPKENHPFGTSFFQEFCRATGLGLSNPCDLDVQREHENIDLLVADKANRLVIVIENKVYSQEGGDQLRRYRKTIESDETYLGWRKAYFYLSMTGEKPTGDPGQWKAIEYDIPARIITDLPRGHRIPEALALVIRNYREIISGAHMTEKQEKLCEKIIGRNESAVEAVIQHGFSRKIEGALISALVEGTEKYGLKMLKTIDRTTSNSFHVDFTSGSLPQGLFFQFYISGGGGRIWLGLITWTHKNRKLAGDFTEFSKRYPDLFEVKGSDWKRFYGKEIISDESGLSEPERVAKIVKEWNEFLSDKLPQIEKKMVAFNRSRSSR